MAGLAVLEVVAAVAPCSGKLRVVADAEPVEDKRVEEQLLVVDRDFDSGLGTARLPGIGAAGRESVAAGTGLEVVEEEDMVVEVRDTAPGKDFVAVGAGTD